MINKILFIFFLMFFCYANDNNALNSKDISDVNKIKKEIQKNKNKLMNDEKTANLKDQKHNKEITNSNVLSEINSLLVKISKIDSNLKDNYLIKRYLNYLSYSKILLELETLKRNAKSSNHLADEQEFQYNNKIRIKENELELINEYKGSPIGGLINPPEIKKFDKLTNPFGIIGAFSYLKKLENNKKQFRTLNIEINSLISLIDKELSLYLDLFSLDKKVEYKDKILFLNKQINDFKRTLDIVSTTEEVYIKRIEQISLEVRDQISEQIEKMFSIFLIIVIFFIISFSVKLALRKYFSQNESFYMINKIINFTLGFLVIMVILFSYIDNVAYIVTILGFASAGIAIALKDWFMSIFGWMVIVTSGFIQVGDRIRVTKGEIETVGDVLDISLFKITIREDVTMITYRKNRRAGRIYFVPNNYIFSELIANYSHSELKTVWDGIDINLTFDSNHKKAQNIIKDIIKRYSKGYSDITKKQLSRMRNKYQLRAMSVEPRIFVFIESSGIVISSWYLTNSFASLILRSTISSEIIDALIKEDDIHIAYQTQQININDTQNPYGPSRQRRVVKEFLDEFE